MAICTYLAPNGEKSLLAKALEHKYGAEKTAQMWNYARTNMDKFTTFDKNGDPLMSHVEENLSSRLSEKELKAAEGSFKRYPELSALFNGDKVLYTQYLKSVFPESAFSGELFFHGSPDVIDEFRITERSHNGALWFTGNFGNASRGGAGDNIGKIKNVYAVLLDIRKPRMSGGSGYEITLNPPKYREGMVKDNVDGIVFSPTFQVPGKERVTVEQNQVVVFDSKKVHIIGGAKDLAMAKEFLEASLKPATAKDYMSEGALNIAPNNQPMKGDDSDFVPGRYVKYKEGDYMITKRNDSGTYQIYSPTFAKSPNAAIKKTAKLSVSKASLTVTDNVAKVIPYKDANYIVTSKGAIISLTTNKVMEWGEENGDRKAILELAQGKPVTASKTYTGKVTALKANEVFVFGSNPIGVNGNPSKGTGGAALVAHQIAGVQQGEKMDNKLSASGKAWGITTVTGPGKKLSKTPVEIQEGIKKLYEHAAQNPEQRFLVAYQGKEGRNLNGYSNQQLADMFSAFPRPANVIFEEQFSTLLKEPITTGPVKVPNPVNIGAKFPKDQVKADYATGIIGYGSHSTGKYAAAFGGTTENFEAGKIYMISVNGANRENQAESLAKTKTAIDKAIAAGVNALVADNAAVANSEHNKGGEGVIRAYLLEKGLTYKEIDGVGFYFNRNSGKASAPVVETSVKVYNGVKAAAEAVDRGEAMWVMRDSSSRHFGNPFTSSSTGTTAEIVMPTITEAVQAYEDWLRGKAHTDVAQERRKWIILQIASGALDGKVLAYYKKLNEPSHADVLARLVNGARVKKATRLAVAAKVPGEYSRNVQVESIGHKVTSERKKASIESMTNYIKTRYAEALENPDVKYLIEYEYRDGRAAYENGFTGIEMARLFDEAGPVPPNIVFRKSMQNTINTLPSNYALNYNLENQETRVVQNMDGKAMTAQMDRLFIPIFDETGKQTGHFTPQAQTDAANTVLYLVQKQLRATPDMKLGEVIGKVLMEMKAQSVNPKSTDKRRADFANIVNGFSFAEEAGKLSVAELLLSLLESYGVTVRNKNQLLTALEIAKDQPLAVKQGAEIEVDIEDHSHEAILPDEFSDINIDAEYEEGETAKDYNDVSAQIDPRDTASWRLKMFMSTLESIETGTYKPVRTMKEGVFNLKGVLKGVEAAIKPETTQEEVTKMVADFINSNKTNGDKLALHLNRRHLYHEDQRISVGVAKALKELRPMAGLMNSLGSPVIVNFNSFYEQTLSALADVEPTFEARMRVLEEAAEHQPTFKFLIDHLMASDVSLQNEFVKVTSLHYSQYMSTVFNRTSVEGRAEWMLRSFATSSVSAINQTMDNWKQAQKLSKSIKVENGERVLDTKAGMEKAQAWIDVFNATFQLNNNKFKFLAPADKVWGTTKKDLQDKEKNDARMLERAELRATLHDAMAKLNIRSEDIAEENDLRARQIVAVVQLLELHGINFTVPMADHLLRAHPGAFNTKNGVPKGILAKFVWKSLGHEVMHEKSVTTIKGDDGGSITANNPLYTLPQVMKKLAHIYLAHTSPIRTSSSRTTENKVVYSFTQNTALTHAYRMLSDIPGDSELAKMFPGNYTDGGRESAYRAERKEKYDAITIAKNSYLLDTNAFENGYLSSVDGMKAEWAQKGVTRTDMSDREQMLNTISMFQNEGKDIAHYISLTHSDKSVTPVFTNFPKASTGNGTTVSSRVMTVLTDLFLAESTRVRAHWNEDFNHDKYNVGKKVFFFLPQFNYEVLQSMVGTELDGAEITQENVDSLWAGEGNIREPHESLTNEAMDFVRAMLRQHVRNLTDNTVKAWTDAGIVDGKDFAFSSAYVRHITKDVLNYHDAVNVTYDGDGQRMEDHYLADQDNSRIPVKTLYDNIVRAAAQDYAVNYFMVNTSMSQLVYGDPAEAAKYKGMVDEKGNIKPGQVLNVIDATMKEYSKRLAKDIAPGQDLHWRENDREYRALTMADVKTAEAYMKSDKVRSFYEKVDATDAQEFVTVREHLSVMLASGVIQKDVYDEMMVIVDRGERKADGWYEFEKPEHTAIIMQPMKPVYVGKQEIRNGVKFTNYVKSSAYALYPPLTHDTEMNKLRRVMEAGGKADERIHRAHFLSAQKLGAPKVQAQVFNKDGTFNQTAMDNGSIVAATTTLDRAGFRIQQEVPYDEEHETIKVVSQMNVLITDGTHKMSGFTVPGFTEKMSGKDLRDHKENIRKQMVSRKLAKFLKEIGTDENFHIRDKQPIYDLLISEAKKRGYNENEISILKYQLEGTQDLDMPLQFSVAAEKFESLMMSLIRGIVNIKVPGKSYIQASSVGYVTRKNLTTMDGVTEEDRRGIVYVPGHDSSQPLRTMYHDADGNVMPAQVIAPFNFMITGKDGKQTKAKITDYMVDGVLDMTKIPKELLQLVGARIPNQGHNSMLPIEIVGFTPESLGDLILVPSGITKQMGADFDVDKLYTYKRPYRSTADGFEWVSTSLEGAKEHQIDDILSTQYFDVHWAVLMHPDMYDKVLSPLDKKDLANEASILTPENRVMPVYFDVTSQILDYQSAKHAKMLVALTSLSVVFNTAIQDKSLRLSEPIEINGVKYSKLSGEGTSTYKGETRTKGDNLGIFQNAALDNANNRLLDNLNLTPDTYKAVAAMMMLEDSQGNAMNVSYATRLLTQPAIMEYSRMMSSGNDSMSKDKKGGAGRLHEISIQKLKESYSKGKGEEEDHFTINPESLLNEFEAPTDAGQLAVIKLFEQLSAVGKRIAELQSLFNQATKGAGPNLISAIDKVNKLEEMLTNSDPDLSGEGAANPLILNEHTLYYYDFDPEGPNELTEMGTLFNATVKTAVGVWGQLLPYAQLSEVIDRYKRETMATTVSVDVQRSILKGMRSYMYASTNALWKGPADERFRLLYNIGGNKSLAQRVADAKGTWGMNDYFMDRLNPIIGDVSAGPDYVSIVSVKSEAFDDNASTSALMSLLRSEDREKRLLAEDLVRYTYLTGGVQDANSFVTKIPTSYLIDTFFSKNLRDMESNYGMMANSQAYLTQFMQHHPQNALKITPDVFKKYLTKGQIVPEIFMVPNLSNTTAIGGMVTRDEEGRAKYVDYVSFRDTNGKWNLFMRKNGVNYIRIDTLGDKYTDEYDGGVTDRAKSILWENRTPDSGNNDINPADMLNMQANDMKAMTEDASGDHYKVLGMPKEGGGYEVAETMLETIQADNQVATALRTVAGVLKGIGEETVADKSPLWGRNAVRPKFKIEYAELEGSLGRYNTTENTIQLDSTGRSADRNGAAETFLHELVHQRTVALMVVAGFSNLNLNEQSPLMRQVYLAEVERFGRRHPQAVKIFEQLDRLRFEALTAFKAKMRAEGKDGDMIIEDVLANEFHTDDHMLAYGLHNMEEFVTHVLTNKDMAEFLNGITNSGNKTFLEAFWDLLSDLLLSISETLGVDIKRDSLLREALTLSLKLNVIGSTKDMNININDAIKSNTTLEVETEREAVGIKSVLETHYNKSVEMTNNFTHIQLKPSNRQALNTPQEIKAVMSKLRKQDKELYLTIQRAPEGTIEEARLKRELRAKQESIKDDIEDLRHATEISAIAEVGQKQMKWVHDIIRKSEPTVAEVAVAARVLDIWATIQDTVYGGLEAVTEYDPELAKLIASAEAIRGNAFLALATKAFNKQLAADGIELTEKDYRGIKDTDTLTQQFRSLEHSTSKVVSSIAVVGKGAAEMRNQNILRLGNKLEDLRNRMKASLGTGASDKDLQKLYDKFMQESETEAAWGLVQEHSDVWTTRLYNLKAALKSDLDRAYNEPVAAARGKRIRTAYNKYWREIKKSGRFVDISILLDPETGKVLKTPESSQEMAELIVAYGSKEAAGAALKEAKERYADFLAERDLEFDAIEHYTTLEKEDTDENKATDAEKAAFKAAKTDAEKIQLGQDYKDRVLAEKKERLKTGWMGRNSPIHFMRNQYGQEVGVGFGSDRYTVLRPRVRDTHFFDQKYAALTETELGFLEELAGIRDTLLDLLPPNMVDKADGSFLPMVPNKEVLTLMGALGSVKPSALTKAGWESISVTKAEKEANRVADSIPIDYLDFRKSSQLTDLERVGYEDKIEKSSKDLIGIMDVFGRMAFHYNHMSEVLDLVNTGETILNSIHRSRLSDPEKGQTLNKTLDVFKYWKEALFFKQSKKLEAVSDRVLYSTNRKENKAIKAEIATLGVEQEALRTKLIDEGLLAPHEQARLKAVEDRLDVLAADGRYFVGSKAADVLISFNQLRTLAFNPFAAVTNISFAWISLWVYGNGRTDYDYKGLKEAHKDMSHSFARFMRFGQGKDPIADKIFNLMGRSNLLSMVNEATYGESNVKGQQQKGYKKAFNAMNWQLSGDYFTKGALMVAMMRKQMVKLQDGSEISLWDATGTDGYWDEAKYGANPEWADESVQAQKAWNKFSLRMNGVSTIVFGNQDRNSPMMARKSMVGRLFGQFRLSWLPEGIAQRWAVEREDVILGRTVKGRYRTAVDLGIMGYGSLMARQVLSALPGSTLNAFDGVTYTKDGVVHKLSDVDIENMRRNLAGMAMTVAFLVAGLTLAHLASPDEEEKKRRRARGEKSKSSAMVLLMNMAARNYQDLTLYSSPGVLETIIGNPVPVFGLVTDFTKLMTASVHLFSDDEKAGEKWKKRFFKLIPALANLNKWEYMTEGDVTKQK